MHEEWCSSVVKGEILAFAPPYEISACHHHFVLATETALVPLKSPEEPMSYSGRVVIEVYRQDHHSPTANSKGKNELVNKRW